MVNVTVTKANGGLGRFFGLKLLFLLYLVASI